MYGWLAVVVFALTSCDSENVTPINDKTLPEAIAKDFYERCEDYTIKRVYTGPEPYFDSGAMETYVTSEDNAGNECVVVYVDNACIHDAEICIMNTRFFIISPAIF